MNVIDLPANSSRYFSSYMEAVSQLPGQMHIKTHPESGHLYNSLFDAQKIKYDSHYSTVNPKHFIYSTGEIQKILPKISGSIFVEIGCGQGELVEWLKSQGEVAIGFDPVCRKSVSYLFDEVFTTDTLISAFASFSRIVFVMRCVLPHIKEPFGFISELISNFPNSQFLLQHQRVEHYLSTHTWTGLMHDHVNIFRLDDFTSHYEVESSSVFCEGEWQQILFRPSKKRHTSILSKDRSVIDKLLSIRRRHLKVLSKHKSIFFFGAAGKGINFAFACTTSGINLEGAIDDSIEFAGSYLEGSGIRVTLPGDLEPTKVKNATLIVMNHSHLPFVRARFKDFASVESLHTI